LSQLTAYTLPGDEKSSIVQLGQVVADACKFKDVASLVARVIAEKQDTTTLTALHTNSLMSSDLGPAASAWSQLVQDDDAVRLLKRLRRVVSTCDEKIQTALQEFCGQVVGAKLGAIKQ
jgi:hypothetical protein